MKRIKFQLKTVFKNKFNYIGLALLLISIIGILIYNAGEVKSSGTMAAEKGFITSMQPILNELETKLADKNLSPSEKKAAQTALDKDKQIVSSYQNILDATSRKDWKTAYALLLEQEKANVKMFTGGSQTALTVDDANHLEQNLFMYRALIERDNMPFQDDTFPTSGANFAKQMMQAIFPILLSLSLIFILVSLFTEPFKDHINRDLLLPRSKANLLTTSLGTGSLISLTMFAGLLLLAYFLATAFFGVGNWNYPIVSYPLAHKVMFFQNLSNIVAPSLILQVLSLLFIVCAVYLISYLLRDRLASLFVSILLLVGLMLATGVFSPLKQIAQYLPTSYINAVSVATGEYAYNVTNYSVGFTQGVIVLSVSIVILLGATVWAGKSVRKY